MALFKNITLTQAGADMLSAFLNGGDDIAPIKITSVGIGDGVKVGEGGSSLGHEVRRLAVETGKVENGVLIVTARLSTDQIEADIVHREIGLYSGETLFAYGNAGDDYDFIPAAGQCTAVIKKITCRLYVGAVAVQIETFKSPDYVTYDAMEQRINDTIDEAIADAQAVANAAVDAAQAASSAAANSANSAAADASAAAESASRANSAAATAEQANSEATRAAAAAGTSAEQAAAAEAGAREAAAEVDNAVSQVLAPPCETEEGTNDLACIWAHLAEIHPGVLEEISFECRHSGTIDAPELYLGIWEEDARGSHQKIGASTNAAAHVTGGYYRWRFDGLKLSGRSLRFLPLTAPEDSEMSGHQLGLWGARTTDGSFVKGSAGGNNVYYFPHAIFGFAAPLDTAVRKAEASAADASQANQEAQAAASAASGSELSASAAAANAASSEEEARLAGQQASNAAQSSAASAEQAESSAQAAAAAVAKIGSVMRYKGSVDSFADLPPAEENELGDFWNTADDDANYAWNGTAWDPIGTAIDLSVFAKQTDLNNHEGNSTLHLQQGEREKLEDKYTKAEIDEKLKNLSTGGDSDHAGSGSGSVQVGKSAKAKSVGATASGAYSTASGAYSTAMGYSSNATGYYSTASGTYSTASGYYSTASGFNSTASGYYSTAMGSYAQAINYSFAGGARSTAKGYSTTCGNGAYAELNGTALGRLAKTVGGGFALGANAINEDRGVGVLCVANGCQSLDDTYEPNTAEGAQGWVLKGNVTHVTQLRLIGANTQTALSLTDGEPALGYTVWAKGKGFVKNVTRKLSEIFESSTPGSGSGSFTERENTTLSSVINGWGNDDVSPSINFGVDSSVSGVGATAFGAKAKGGSYYSAAFGFDSEALSRMSTAVGAFATARGKGSTAIGQGAITADDGVCVLAANDSGEINMPASGHDGFMGLGNQGLFTQFYFIGAGCELSNKYLGGAPGLGYIVYDGARGQITQRGVLPFTSLNFTHTTDFAPALH